MECSCCASLTRRANDFLKVLGVKKKDHTDIAPEALTPEHFDLHETFHHGFPSQPTCLAYDPVQQVLAIGTENGTVQLLGMPGLERWFSHPVEVPILQMLFITNKGLLVTRCDNRTVYLWSLQGKMPSFQHKVVFRTEGPTAISWTYGSEWMYVGTDTSNVYILHTEKLTLSGCWIRWKNIADVYQLEKPGDVMTVQEHPLDQSKVLIAYSRGMCVLWDLKNKITEGRFSYNLSENHTLTSMCWLGNGKSFACSYSDGCVTLWNPAKPGNKPEKTFFPHESDHDRATFKPIDKVQYVNTDSGPWYICSGGWPEDSSSPMHELTIKQGKSFSHLSTTSPIMDFLCLPSSPFPYDCQKPFALVILTKNELVVHDLQSSGFPTFSLPSALDIHLSPVTCVQYCSKCPEELIASLQSVNSKLTAENKSTKPWPLKGGKWGEEVYQMSTDLIITGHADGSVRFWLSSSAIFQPILTVSTSRYFKMKHVTFAPQLDTLMEDEHSVLGVEEEQGVRYPTSHRERKRSRETPSPATGQPKVRSSTPRRIMRSLMRITASTKPTPSTSLPEDESTSPVKSVSPFGLSLGSEEFLAIQEINMCVQGLWMCVANVGGSVLTFDFKMGEVTTTPKSLDVCLNYDTVFDLKSKPTSAATIPPGDWTFREGVKDSQSGFHLTQHCQCYYSSSLETESLPVIVSSMQYSSDIGMLAIGTDQGFTVVDTITNKCLYILSNLTSILYLAKQEIRRGSTPATFSPKPTVMKHASVRSMSTQQFRVMTPGTPVNFVLPEPDLDSPTFLEKVEEYECSVTALEVVQLQLDKQGPPILTLWVGLASGHIAAYIVSIKRPENIGFGPPQRILKMKVFPLRFANKSPIMSIRFLNEQGALLVAPYKALSQDCHERSTEASMFHKLHYAIISDEKRIQSFGFPGFVPAGKVTPPIQNSAILMSEFFTCHDLPCLLSLTSCQHILVHSLPDLEPILHLPFPLLSDIRVLCTFGVLGNGQVLYMSSASEIQRMSLVSNDRLNLPTCLPDVYIHLKDPQPVSRKKYTAINREHLFGKDAGRPRISVVERDSLVSTTETPHKSGIYEPYSKLKKQTIEREEKMKEAVKSSAILAIQAQKFDDQMSKNKA